MKKSLFIVLALLVAGMGFAQKAPTTKLISNSENQIVVNFQLNGYTTSKVQTPQGEQFVVNAPKMASMLEAGAPDLPMFPIPAIIGDQAEMTVNVIDAQYTDYTNVEVAPSKGNFSRQINPEDVPYTYGEMYQQNAFWPATQAYLEKPYILRDFRGQNIMVRPFAYNPVTKTLRVYTNMTIAMTKVSDNGENQKATRRSNTIKVDPEVKAQYNRRFINFGEAGAKYTFDEDFGEMLIICADQYMTNLQPLVDWKNKSGRPTTMVSVTTAGGNNIENIKNYVTNFYNDPDHNLEFLLLVGEYNEITPKNYGSGSGGTCYSDNYLGKIEGNDNYLEVLVGRFSVANAADADLQVNKSIYYERDVQAGATWGNKGMGVGYYGAGSGHFGEDDYQHIDLIRDTLLHYTYEMVTEHHGGSGGDASVSTISGTINEGISIINYCNHGSETSWGVANYSVSNVSALTNDNMLPVVWSVACLNGKFDVGTCFGESWLRANHNGNPAGAVAGMFSFVSQPWIPPMYGQDEMVDILTGWRSTDQFNHTIGGSSLNGSMYVLDMAPGDSYQTFNTWILFGDPSCMIRTDIPTEMSVSVSPSVLLIGMTELQVSADAEYGIATLTLDGEVLASGRIIDGQCTLQFPALSNVGDAELVILGYNKVTYTGTVEVVPAEGAYITVSDYALSAPANYGETIDMAIDFKNVGVQTANNLTATISTESEYINIINAEGSFASINPDEILTVDGFQFEVASNVPDGTRVRFDVNITDGANTWTGKAMVDLHAPVLAFNGIVDANNYLTFTFMNEGSAPFYGGELTLTSCSPDLVFEPATITVEDIIEGGASLTMTSAYTIDPSVEPSSSFEVAYDFTTGSFNYSGIYNVMYQAFVEDFESGTFGEGWTFSQNNAWTIVNGGTKGTKCAKSMNAGINNSDYSMTLTVDVATPGDMTFMYKVSSEQNYDKLHFYMDNQEKGTWSGTVNWSEFTQPVTAGHHTFKWSYTKDSSVNSGDDCAMVDDISFPMTNVYTFIEPASDLVATVEGHDVTLNWTASSEAVSYTVKRDGETLGTVAETTYTDRVEESGVYKYSVCAVDANGSMSAPVNVIVELDFTGVAENQNVKVNVFPNPANDMMNINVNGAFKYQLVNSLGQVVRSGKATNKAVVNVNDLNQGIYFLTITAGNQVSVQKVVVE